MGESSSTIYHFSRKNVLNFLMHIFISKIQKNIFFNFFCKILCCRIFCTNKSVSKFILLFIVLAADYSLNMYRNNFSVTQKYNGRKLSWHNTLCSASGRIKTNAISSAYFSCAICIIL